MGSDNDVAKTRGAAIRRRISDSLRAWRASQGHTQADMANMLGVAEKTYQKWEHNERGMPVHRLAQFCLISGIDANLLLLGRGKARQTPPPNNNPTKKTA